MREGWNVVLRYDEEIMGVNIWFIHKQGGQETVVNPLNLTLTTNLTPGIVLPQPTIRIDRTQARQFLEGLATGLADAGFRPDELKAKDSELEAIRYHLEDMRTLAMDTLLPPETPPRIIRRS